MFTHGIRLHLLLIFSSRVSVFAHVALKPRLSGIGHFQITFLYLQICTRMGINMRVIFSGQSLIMIQCLRLSSMQGKASGSLQLQEVVFVLINTCIPFSDLNYGTPTGIFLFFVPEIIVSALFFSAGKYGASVYSLRLD